MEQNLIDRFWSHVSKSIFPLACWKWTGALRLGYGRFRVGDKKVSSHRFSYELINGRIPKGKIIMHTCDNPSCVNPNHLVLGTQKQNMRDASNKNRLSFQKRTHCPKGHEYKGDNLILVKTKSGKGRQCAVCSRIAALKSYKMHKIKRNLANKAWRDNNKEYRKEYKKSYRQKLKEKNQ